MKHFLATLAACLIGWSLTGCAAHGPRITIATDKLWGPTYIMRNGTIKVVIAPAIGRIMSYGYEGGENMLWHHPRPEDYIKQFGGFINWGGDKAWIWPQEDWPLLAGRSWPPPGDGPEGALCAARIEDGDLILTSAPVRGYGARIVRRIHMEKTGTAVRIDTSVDRLEGSAPLRMAAWNNTQVPAPSRLYARLLPVAPTTRPYGALAEESLPISGEDGSILVLTMPASSYGKIGMDADVIGALIGNRLFLIQSLTPPDYHARPHEAMQFYADVAESAHRSPDLGRYLEMQTTGPIKSLLPGESATLSVRWRLLPAEGSRQAIELMKRQ